MLHDERVSSASHHIAELRSKLCCSFPEPCIQLLEKASCAKARTTDPLGNIPAVVVSLPLIAWVIG